MENNFIDWLWDCVLKGVGFKVFLEILPVALTAVFGLINTISGWVNSNPEMVFFGAFVGLSAKCLLNDQNTQLNQTRPQVYYYPGRYYQYR